MFKKIDSHHHTSLGIFKCSLLACFVLLYTSQIAFSNVSIENGKKAIKQEQYDKAITILNQAVKKDKSAEAWYLLGVSYLKLNKFKKAEMAFLQASHLDSKISFTDKKQFYQQLNLSQNPSQPKKTKKSTWFTFTWKRMLLSLSFAVTSLLLILILKRKYRLRKQRKIQAKNMQSTNELQQIWKAMNLELSNLKRLELKINQSSQYQMKHLITSIRDVEKKVNYYNNQYENYLLQIRGTHTENELKQSMKEVQHQIHKVQLSLQISTRSS